MPIPHGQVGKAYRNTFILVVAGLVVDWACGLGFVTSDLATAAQV